MGGNKSFVNTKEDFYLVNSNGEKNWYVTDNGSIALSDGTDILGVKPVVSLKSDISIKSGSGKEDDPYILDSKYFGSYVKLDKDIWRVYDEEDNNLRLVLTDYLKVNGVKLNACPLSKNEPNLGDNIFVYGYPNIEIQGTDLKMTQGIVSGKNGYNGDKYLFQFDA